MDDAELSERFSTGDADTVRVVYQRYGRLVYAVAYKVLGNAVLAEDATQQAFVQAWRAAGTYDPTRPLGTWLATIAQRAAVDLYRRERRHRGLADLESIDASLLAEPASVDAIADLWEVREAVQSLPEADQQVIRMQHFDELTHAEIASRLSLPVGTVKSRSFRAHKRLAGMLGHLRTEPDARTEPSDGTG